MKSSTVVTPPAAAAREISLFFSPDEILTYSMADAAWLGG